MHIENQCPYCESENVSRHQEDDEVIVCHNSSCETATYHPQNLRELADDEWT